MIRSACEAAEQRSLGARVLELERECSAARDQARLLVALQRAYTKIAMTRTPDEVIAQMLRAAYDPLGFSRAIYFSVDREHGIEARFAVDGSDVVESCDAEPDIRPGSAILQLLRHEAGDGVGRSGELSVPFVDVRRWYVLSALTNTEGTLGILYADGHRSPIPRDSETGLVRALATIAAVSIDNSILFSKTQELASRDPLTGLFNRRAFAERLLAEISVCNATGHSLTYVMIDLDDFKAINDAHGHAHGDIVLKLLAETLVGSSRANDVVARYAGDEFVVMLADVDPVLAHALVARLSNDLRAQGLSCSLGAALYPRDATDAGTLLAAADGALYVTKAAGKNGFSFA